MLASFRARTSNDQLIFVEVDEPAPNAVQRISRVGDTVSAAAQDFDAALAVLRPIVEAIERQLEALAPNECEVELGLKLTAEHSAILVKASGEAHVTLKLTWKREPA
jgi:deoxyhypusine synthase